MTHDSVYNAYKTMFPTYIHYTSIWFQNGKNSIRVRVSGRDLIFTYNNADDWKLETVDSFLKEMKK